MSLRAVHDIFEEIKHVDASDRAVRATMRVFLVLGLVVSVWWNWTLDAWTVPVPWIPAAVGSLLWGLAAMAPALARPFHRLWMAFAVVLGFFMTRVILLVVFFGLVSPIGIVMRLAGRDPLDRSPTRSADSWWIRRPAPELPSQERLKRLF